MEKQGPFVGINRESAIAKAQDWARINGKYIVNSHEYPENPAKPYGWFHCTIEVIEQTEYAIEGIITDDTYPDNINAV